jgi:hypothetical protein
MTKLSNRDAVLALLAKVEQAVVDLDKTRTQSALESYQSAKDLLLDAFEAVRYGNPVTE